MKSQTNILAALILGAGVMSFAAGGCELISSVDRTKIPGSGGAGGAGGGAGGTTNPSGGASNPTTGGTTMTGGGTTANGGSGGTGQGGAGGAANGGGGAGQGGTGGCMNPGDCADPGECKHATCSGNMCGSAHDPDGTICSTGGCKNGSCVPLCQDGVQDGNETGIDCGGSCLTCNYQLCNNNSDCASNTCLVRVSSDPSVKLCYPATCADGVKDGMESDVDCGGGNNSCPFCDTGKACTMNTDCANGVCTAMVCL